MYASFFRCMDIYEISKKIPLKIALKFKFVLLYIKSGQDGQDGQDDMMA